MGGGVVGSRHGGVPNRSQQDRNQDTLYFIRSQDASYTVQEVVGVNSWNAIFTAKEFATVPVPVHPSTVGFGAQTSIHSCHSSYPIDTVVDVNFPSHRDSNPRRVSQIAQLRASIV